VKRIALLGSTGSIGKQALEVVKANSRQFKIVVLTAQNNAEKLIEQAIEFRPDAVVIGCRNSYEMVRSALAPFDIKVHSGMDALNSIVEMDQVDTALIALVGFAGLIPAVNAIKAGKEVALANKESLVVAGELISSMAQEKGVRIIPIDSEHSAIFQCMMGENPQNVEKIFLTASGGPFFGKSIDYLENVTVKQALAHPRWDMGQKISIDSASLMNKGLEVIEAKWLFNLSPDQIEVIIHPESVVHSIVQFIDGSMKAQLGPADMRFPIHFALSYPERLQNQFPRFDFLQHPQLTFLEPDRKTFRSLDLAYYALSKRGNMPCILNAANEAAVDMFLKGQITFLQIPEIIEQCLVDIPYIISPDLEDLNQTNRQTKTHAIHLVNVQFKPV